MQNNNQGIPPTGRIRAIHPEEKIRWGTILKIVLVIVLLGLVAYLFLNPQVVSEAVNSFIENIGPKE